MGQIQQQGKDMLEIVEKYEVPQEFHAALWAAYETGAEMGFWKAATRVTTAATIRPIDFDEFSKNAKKEQQ